jgi:tetratricopeptide (TPR) repeat protein
MGDSFSRAWSWYWLGYAQKELGEFEQAVESLERSRAIARERRTAVEAEPYRLAILAEAHAGLGDGPRGRELAEQGIELARKGGQLAGEMLAILAFARVLRGSLGAAARSEVEPALARGFELAESSGSRSLEPLLRVELAEVLGLAGDEEGRQRELREAHRIFIEIGATGRAEAVAAELATAAR